MTQKLKIEVPFSPQNKKVSMMNSRTSIDSAGILSLKSPTYKQPRPSFMISPTRKNEDFNILIQEINNDLAKKRATSVNRKLNLEELSQEQLLELAIETLQKSPETRTSMDIRMLVRTTKNVEFFHNYDKDTHEQICKYITYLFSNKGSTLFTLGSIGDTFYIILKGSVEVWVNLPQVIEETKPDGIIETRTEMVLTNVRTLLAGSSFGELALMENKPRAATITCAEGCHFGVLDKSSFDHILKEKEKRKLYEKIDFFASMKLFSKWSYNAVKLLYYQVDSVDYIRGQCVLKAGQEALGIYLIKSGEFKVMVKVPILFSENDQNEHALSKGILHDFSKTIELCVLSTGEIIGDEEIIANTPFQASIYCVSNKGSLFFLSKKEFFRRVWSEENSHLFLQNTIKSKKKWREDRITEITRMEKDKILKSDKPYISLNMSPKRITTHLLYKKLSQLKLRQNQREHDFSSQKDMDISEFSQIKHPNSEQDSFQKNLRISNKRSKEDEIYFGFKEQNIKKLEILKKFQEVKEKMNMSSNKSPKNSKSFLMSLINGYDPSKKVQRQRGKIEVQTPRISNNRSTFYLTKVRTGSQNNRKKISCHDSDSENNFRSNYKKIQAFTSIQQNGKLEMNSELLGYKKIYSEEQKIRSELKANNEFIDGSENKRTPISTNLRRFKKNIQNIFISSFNKEKKIDKMNSTNDLREGSSFDFFNVSSKTIYNKMI